MRYAQEIVTPEIAKTFLNTLLPGQRRVRKSAVTRYAEDMSAGRWLLTPSPIAIGENGHLLDGQHRLWAVVESGVSVPMFVCYGVPNSAFGALDIGVTRSASDLTGGRMSNETIAMVRGALTLCSPFQVYGVSARMVIDTAAKNSHVVKSIIAVTPSSLAASGNTLRMFTASTRSSLLRGVPYYGLATVLSFAEAIVENSSEGIPRTARDYMVSSRSGTSNNTDRVTMFKKFSRLLRSYAEGDTQLRRLYASSDTPFPVLLGSDQIADFTTAVTQ
jgi:hypothetical protein